MLVFKKEIFIVDDEVSVCRAIQRTLNRLNVQVTCFNRAEECLAKVQETHCDLVVTDVKMPGMDGIELLSQIKKIAPWLPVLMVTGYGDIPLAVRAVKLGAADLLEKPSERERFIQVVQELIKQKQPSDEMLGRELTKTELTILHYVLEGQSSKEIASKLHRSTRTVEFHRQHIMRKLNVSNVVELIKRVSNMGIYPLQ